MLYICLDAGHGSNTAGKRTYPFNKDVDIDGDGSIDVKKGQAYREHYANTMVSNLVAKLLAGYGVGVLKTGWDDANAKDDPDIDIEERQRQIRDKKCLLVVSTHFNASAGTSGKFDNAQGLSVYIREEVGKRRGSEAFAKIMLKNLVDATGQKSRGIGTGKLGMCNATGMNVKAAILLELAYMTNEKEAQDLMANLNYCETCAKAIVRSILEYIKTIDITAWQQMVFNCNIDSGVFSYEKLVVDGLMGPKTMEAKQKLSKLFE